jgi:hypothetical protein|tara:strand:- start:4299 stop:6590 length:2292 start_codon:yes stop_codon:yes gene_type:complete
MVVSHPGDESDVSDLEQGRVVSSDGTQRVPPVSHKAGSSYGSVSETESTRSSPSPRTPRTTHHHAPETALAHAFRVAEPVVFWCVCTFVALFSTLSMIRITASPNYPASLPEGHDGRTLQVGTVANSTEAVSHYIGCELTAGGRGLRDDVGTRRFPDFLIAGAKGAPSSELAQLLDEKNVACAGKLERKLAVGGEGDTVRDVLSESTGNTLGDGLLSESTGSTLRDVLSETTTGKADAKQPVKDRFPTGVVTLGETEDKQEGKKYFTQGTDQNADAKLAWSPSKRFPSTDDGNNFFSSSQWRRAPIPLEAQKEYLDAHFHRCGEETRYLGIPRFQLAGDFMYHGWSAKRACESMGGEDVRVVALLANPVDHSVQVFADTLQKYADSVERWTGLVGMGESTLGSSMGGTKNHVAEAVTYTKAGFRTAVEVDLHIAETCGSRGLLLATSDLDFKKHQTCCADAAKSLGYSAWPGCPGGCSVGLTHWADKEACDTVGELGFSPVRSGVWVDLLRKMYKHVHAKNVMVVTSDQAKRSGIPTLAVAVVEWRLLGLPLVDPMSVTVDLMRARALATAAVGGNVHADLSRKDDTVSTLGMIRIKTRVAFKNASAALFGKRRVNAAVSVSSSLAVAESQTSAIGRPFPPPSNEPNTERYVSRLPETWTAGTKPGEPAVPHDLAKLIRGYHDIKVVELNALLGNGVIRWWTVDGTPLPALQSGAFLATQNETPRDKKVARNEKDETGESAATGLVPFVSLVGKRVPGGGSST